MEGLQFAQILADLTQLQQSDNTAALNILRCNKIISEEEVVKNAKKTAVMAGKRPKFDNLGRKRTDPLTSSESEGGVEIGGRKNSRLKLSSESQGTIDQDLKRAKDLMALYRLRSQIEHKDTIALAREKSRVQAVAQKYVAWENERRQKAEKQAKSHPSSN